VRPMRAVRRLIRLHKSSPRTTMKTPKSVRSAETFGRVRLSQSFFMRDFLYSEIAAITGLQNLPDDPDLAIAAGRRLCQDLLEPLQATFGRLAIRSAYRSPEVNAYGNAHFQNCGSNERNRARHIWDQRSADGGMGAMTSVVVPWLVDRLDKGVVWQAMAWWIHDTCRTASCSFLRRSPRSISAGMSSRGVAFRISHRRKASSPSLDFQTTTGTIATNIAAFRRLNWHVVLCPVNHPRQQPR
jgi:hypothetical protein